VHSNSPVKKSKKPLLSKEEVKKIEGAQVKMDMTTKEGFKDLIKFQMRVFD